MSNIYRSGIVESNGIYTVPVLSLKCRSGIAPRMLKSREEEIGRRIEQRRKELGLTREQLAERMNVTPTTIYRKEREKGDGKRSFDVVELMNFADALECDLDRLLPISTDPGKNRFYETIAGMNEDDREEIYRFAEFKTKKP